MTDPSPFVRHSGLMEPQNYSHVQCINECLTNEEAYKEFKRDPRYREVLEHVSPELGLNYLLAIRREYPEIFKHIDWESVRKNDSIGSPLLHGYENFLPCHNANFSPTNFRYLYTGLKILEQLNSRNLSPARVVEIGGGYGGQLYMVNLLSKFFGISIEKYLLIDLETISLHQRKYLNDMGVNNFECYSFEDIRDGVKECEPQDLLISNFALSETHKDIQDMYIEKVVPQCTTCFILWNTEHIHPHFSPPDFIHYPEGVGGTYGIQSGPHNKLIVST